MSKRVLGLDHAPLVSALQTTLSSEPDPVRQQIAIELVAAAWALRYGGRYKANFIADSMCKHIRQILSDLNNDDI